MYLMFINIVENGLKSFFYFIMGSRNTLLVSTEREENVFPIFDHDGQRFIVDVAVKT